LLTQELTLAMILQKLQVEAEAVQAEHKDSRLYDPEKTFEVGQRVVFPAMEFATATVEAVREGDNPQQYGDFSVIQVQFDKPDAIEGETVREFASALTVEHKLNASDDDTAILP